LADSLSKGVKTISFELVLSVASILVVGGIAFGSLSRAQEVQSTEIRALELKQETIRETVNQIQVSVATIESHQESQKEASEKAADERRRIEVKLDRITERLLER
tara:strand:+ start:9097 stop:9411 length:315 start_codon:yes stop_codon:yes gene_type:complete